MSEYAGTALGEIARLIEDSQKSKPQPAAPEEIFGVERYRVEKTSHGFWPYCVMAGNGTRELYAGHLKTCARVASELATAFEDGKFIGSRADQSFEADAKRLALELECLLLSCKDNAAVSKWWDSSHEALEQHRQLLSDDPTPPATVNDSLTVADPTHPVKDQGEDRKDAERYRWLRDASVPPHQFYLSVPIEFEGVRFNSREVDSYIDAALAAGEPK